MDRFLFKISKPKLSSVQTPVNEESSKRAREEINLAELPADPIDRKRISSYNPNDRDRVRRAYLQRGPYQPRNHKFPQKVIGNVKRRFCVGWFKTYKPWLEYSVKVDAAFCLFCYLCADDVDEDEDTSFVTGGFSNWKKKERLKVHVGGLNSSHNQCRRKCEDLMNQDYNIGHSFDRQTDQNKLDYETSKAIVEDIGGDYYSILVDECRDSSIKEQMAIVIRYVNKKGYVIERFLGIVHVPNTTSVSLKEAIELILGRHKLSMSQIRGQGYDGASNMRGEFNGLKSLILNDNSSAYYVHCFAHQLQLVLVAVAKNDPDVASLFTMIGSLVNVVGGSCKRRDMLREKHAKKIVDGIDSGEIESGKGKNQEFTLQRATDTRWSSHCKTLVNIGILFPSILEVLGIILEDAVNLDHKGEAKRLLTWLLSFDFAFTSILMKSVLKITNELCLTLQRKDVDIVNAMKLVQIAKQRLETMRNDGWEHLDKEVSLFCHKYTISIPNMNDAYELPGRPRRVAHKVTIRHHYEIEIFKAVIDWMLQELNNRFSETTTELLSCMACLSPDDSFSSFDKDKLVRLVEFYPLDFSATDREILDDQFETFLWDMKSSIQFHDLEGIGCLAAKLVETKKHKVYQLVYRLIKLVLVLPVSTASVERSFSAMKIVKTRLRNKMGDDWLNHCLVTYIEKDVFEGIDNELVIQKFQTMGPRRGQLPKR